MLEFLEKEQIDKGIIQGIREYREKYPAAPELAGRVPVAKLNVDDAQVLAQKYEVETIPTLILFRGGQASEQLINPASKAAILEWLKGQGAIED